MKVAIFDLDGTILDSLGAWELVPKRYLLSFGVENIEPLDLFFRDNGFRATITHLQKEYLPYKTENEIEMQILSILEAEYAQSIPAFEGACQYVISLWQTGIKLVLLTANRYSLANAALKRLGIEACFSKVIAASEEGTSKSDVKIYHDLVSFFNAAPRECYMFDDSIKPLAAAREAGLISVGVCHGGDEMNLEKLRACSTLQITSFSQLISALPLEYR